MTTFADLGVADAIVRRLNTRGITSPFPVQSAALPDALAGRDVIARAPTGSGKTIAFGIPLVERARSSKPRRPRALVLVPTRELAAQVQREIGELAGDRGRRVLSIYGGTSYTFARKGLNHGVDIVVACPGRLEDMLEQGALTLDDVTTLVIDEADRMADMGFMPAVRRIASQCSETRQTMLFSATLGADVRALIDECTVDPTYHDVKGADDAAEVDHLFWRVAHNRRVDTAAEIIQRFERAIVFTRTKHGADRLATQLGQRGISVAAIHGDRTQAQRDRAIRAIKSGDVDALIATDVAARGVHVEQLPVVVHYDPPQMASDYVHRSGRTGRAGAPGTVISLVADHAVGQVTMLRKHLGIPGAVQDPETATPLRLVLDDDTFTLAQASETRPTQVHAPRGGYAGETTTPESGRDRGPRRERPTSAPRRERGAAPSRNRAGDDRRPRVERNEFNAPRSESRDRRPRTANSYGDTPRHNDRDRRDRRDRDQNATTGSERPESRHQSERAPRANHDGAVVTFFNESKGYGFCVDDAGRDHFIHYSNIAGDGFRTLRSGQRVTFDSVSGAKGLEARNVRVLV